MVFVPTKYRPQYDAAKKAREIAEAEHAARLAAIAAGPARPPVEAMGSDAIVLASQPVAQSFSNAPGYSFAAYDDTKSSLLDSTHEEKNSQSSVNGTNGGKSSVRRKSPRRKRKITKGKAAKGKASKGRKPAKKTKRKASKKSVIG